jgi:UDP-glucose 4-epimerase
MEGYRYPFSGAQLRTQGQHHSHGRGFLRRAISTCGAYNIAGDGVISMSDVVAALGGRPVRVPAVAATVVLGALARLPFVPSAAQWLHVARTSVVMDTSKAKTQLSWTPRYTSAQTLQALAASL